MEKKNLRITLIYKEITFRRLQIINQAFIPFHFINETVTDSPPLPGHSELT